MERRPKIRRIDFYPDDWIAGTVGLTHEERSLYISVCAAIWSRGGPAEVAYVKQICGNGRGRSGHFKRALDGLVAKGKVTLNWTPTGLELAQKRALTELELALNRTRKKLESLNSNGLGEPSASAPTRARTPSPSPSPSKKEKKPTPGGVVKESAAEPPAAGAAPPPKKPSRSIADSWQPDERDRAYAASKGYDTAWVDDQAEMFRDHHLKTGKPFCNWHACWRTWVQNAPQFTRNGGKSNGNGHAHTLTAANKRFLDGRQATLRAVLRRERAAETGDC